MIDEDVVIKLAYPVSLDDVIRECHPIAVRVSRSVVKQFVGYTEQADLVQELMLWTLKNEDKVREYLTPTDEDDKCVIGRRKLHTCYRRVARGVGHKAKAEVLGYDVGDLHFYSRALVEELLPRALDYDNWNLGPSVEESRGGHSTASTGNDHYALLADIKRAYEQASESDQALLHSRFVASPPTDEITLAFEEGVSRQAINKRVEKALGRMVSRLGGGRPDFGGLQ